MVRSEGENFAIACHAARKEFDIDGETNEMYWSHPVHGRIERSNYRNLGRSVFVNNAENQLMLSFHPVMHDDSGDWTCTAMKTGGKIETKSFTFEVIGENNINITIKL